MDTETPSAFGITPSARPFQAVNNAETLVALRAGIKTDDELAQWQQLVDRELAQLAHFTKEGEGRLQRSSSNLQTAQAADERTRSEAEVTHIKGLLDQLDVAAGKLSATRGLAPVAAAITPPAKPQKSNWPLVILALVLTLIVIAAAVIDRPNAPAARPVSESASAARQTVAYAEIEAKNKELTGVQWRNYTIQTQGKYADKWVGWVTDVSDSSGYNVHLNMEGPDSYTLSKVSFDTDKVSATRLGKKQQVVFSGQIESIRDLLGVQISLVNVTMEPVSATSVQTAGQNSGASTSGPVYLGEETPTTICDNMRDMTSAQWQDYFMKLEGKRVDHWTGWVLDVKNNFTNLDTVVVDVSIPYSLLTNRQTMINIPHDQALLLKKRQQIEIAGTLLGAIDINGVCAISFKTSRLI